MLSPGDIVLLDFPYTNQVGSKVRPGLVLSVNQDHLPDDVNVAYITSEIDAYIYDPSAVSITAKDMAQGTLKHPSVARVDKVLTIHSSKCRKVARLSNSKIDETLRKATLLLVESVAANKYTLPVFTPGTTVIPPSGKVIGVQELKYMVEASLDGWLTTGRFNAEFEQKLAKFIGVNRAITVNSGSSANLIAFTTLTSPKLGNRAIQKGDEVIGVAAAFPTTVNPILQFGAVPVFVDVDPCTYNIDATKIEAAISPKTKAIMLAHSLGNPFNLDVVTVLCQRYNLWLIEDCCDALGTTYRGKMVGTFGDIATLSFYPAHHITMGEGGAVFSNNPKLMQIAESIRDWGRDCYCQPGKDNTCGKCFSQQLGDLPYGYDHKYNYSHLGYNLKLSDMQAACGLAQLEKATQFIQVRKDNFAYLKNRMKSSEEFLQLPEATEHSDPSWFGFPITVKENSPVTRLDLLTYLDEYKIGSRLLFAGNLTRQPYMIGANYRISGDLTNTDNVMNNTLWIGLQPALSREMLEFAARKIDSCLGVNCL